MVDAGVSNVSLCGPENLLNLVESLRFFVSRRKLSISVLEFDSHDICFNDGQIRVYPIILNAEEYLSENERQTLRSSKENIQNLSSDLSSLISRDPNTSFYNVGLSRDRSTSTNGVDVYKGVFMSKFTTSTKPHNIAMSYACHLPDIPGKFDSSVATKLGIPPGPLRGKLVRGESVELPDGRVINPKDCISAEQPGPVLLVLYCQNERQLIDLVNHDAIAPYRENGKYARIVEVIIHMVPEFIFNSEVYTEWIRGFNNDVQHIVVNKDQCAQEIIYSSATETQFKLNSIYPAVFKKPFYSYSPNKPILANGNLNITSGEALLKYHMLPKNLKGLDIESCIERLDYGMTHSFINSDPEVVKLKENIGNVEVPESRFNILFTGTGSAIPSKYRNVSGIYVNTNRGESFLLDAGEGTVGQIYRVYGDEYLNVLNNLNVAFISHIHADHHLGLINVLTKRSPDRPPLAVVGPSVLGYWLNEYKEIQHINFVFMDINNFNIKKEKIDRDLYDIFDGCNFMEIRSTDVIHCPLAYGVTITHADGWKITFSGDCRPTESLARIGKDSTVLIHEATFEDDLGEDAVKKGHSTTSEAIQIAIKMAAKYLLMNHFSQRYPKIPSFDGQYASNTIIAFDLMQIGENELPRFHQYYEILKYIYSNLGEDDEDDDVLTQHVSKKTKM